ncbi:hypothetical protein OAJ39_02780 [Alphaproteobacteria bacterium]|jgi:hypothetical protein|nr:hypothetical protein [Alphaproteobacteria bacterium]
MNNKANITHNAISDETQSAAITANDRPVLSGKNRALMHVHDFY